MVQFAGFDIEVPFGPAAGAINGPNEALVVQQLRQVILSPAGFALAGSFTMEGGEGDAHYGRTYYHNTRTGQTVNSMNLPNVGVKAAENIYRQLAPYAADHDKPLGASVSAAAGEDPLKVLPEAVYRMLAAGAHFVEANYSCPNKRTSDGDCEPILGYDPDAVGETRNAILQQIGYNQAFGEKWPSPVYGNEQIIGKLALSLHKSKGGVYYVSGPNTIPNQRLYDETGKPALEVPDNLGGMSGPATASMARAVARRLDHDLPFGVLVVSTNGVISGQEVFDRTNQSGVALTAGVTIYFENEAKGVDYGQTGVRITEEYMAASEAAASR